MFRIHPHDYLKSRYFQGALLNAQTNSTLLLTEVALPDDGAYKVEVQNEYGSVTSTAAVLTVVTPLNLADALDAPGYLWTTGGNSPWLPETNVTADGIDAAVSGVITDYQESWVQTVVNGPGQLSFKWKASSELGFDRLVFELDGLALANVSGETAWLQQTQVVTVGQHQLRWVYAKDGSISAGQDRSWLDQVSYNPESGVLQPVYSLNPKARQRDGMFQIDLVGQLGMTIVVEGSFDLLNWVPLVTITNLSGTTRYIDSGTPSNAKRFYRVSTP